MMIEKMAKALFEVSHEPDHEDDWNALSEPWRNNFRQHARAALTVMLDPTDAMTAEGSDYLLGAASDDHRLDAQEVFMAMIRVALDENQ